MKLIDYDVKYLLNSSHVNTDRTLKLACATDSELIIPAGKSTKSSAANIKVQVSPAEYWYIFNGTYTRTKFRRALLLLFASVKMARKIFHAIPPHIFRESFRESYPGRFTVPAVFPFSSASRPKLMACWSIDLGLTALHVLDRGTLCRRGLLIEMEKGEGRDGKERGKRRTVIILCDLDQ